MAPSGCDDPSPANLNALEPLIYELSDAELWCRSHRADLGPIFFGKSATQRWDAPHGEFGVLYLGSEEYCAFMESIGRTALKSRFIPKAMLEDRALSKVRFDRALRLIDLADSAGLTRIGAEGSLTNAAAYANSQCWSKALREHPEKPDGIYYRSRHDPSLIACALYDHCESFVHAAGPPHRWSEDRGLLGAILDHYRFGTDLV